MHRTSLEDATCPVARSLDVVGDFWSLLLVRDAFRGHRRFGEFQKSFGVAKNILAARLRLLVERGIFELAPADGGGPHREYVLTRKGEALLPVVEALRAWGDRHCPRPEQTRRRRGEARRRGRQRRAKL